MVSEEIRACPDNDHLQSPNANLITEAKNNRKK